MESRVTISSGPLQGLTDAVFRHTHQQIFGGIDSYLGPYLRLDNHKEPKPSQIRDMESLLNHEINYVPQLMGNDPTLLLARLNWLYSLGYQHANWNLGCPYPMVTKRNMGAGLLNQASYVQDILDKIMSHTPISFSIKCRLGLLNDEEIFPLIEVFNNYQIKELIIHARTAKQMYKGKAKPEKLLAIIKQSKHAITYNGDIDSVEKYQIVQKLFKEEQVNIMLGRGLLKNPFLAQQIKGENLNANEMQEKLQLFHDKLIYEYGQKLQDHQLLMKMRTFWDYFSHSFTHPHKVYKLVKKAGSMSKYRQAIVNIFQNYCPND